MKTMENKEVTIREAKTRYTDLIKSCVEAVNQQKGVTVEGMRNAIKVLDVIEAAGEEKTVEFEDTLVEVIKEKVKIMKWLIVDKELVAFANYIEKL